MPKNRKAPAGWFDRALDNPAREYADPSAVLKDARLSREQKHSVLLSWEQDERRMSASVSEGLDGGKPAMLGRVVRARIALEEKTKE